MGRQNQYATVGASEREKKVQSETYQSYAVLCGSFTVPWVGLRVIMLDQYK